MIVIIVESTSALIATSIAATNITVRLASKANLVIKIVRRKTLQALRIIISYIAMIAIHARMDAIVSINYT